MFEPARIPLPAGLKARARRIAGLCWMAALILGLASSAGAGQAGSTQTPPACVQCHAGEGLSDGGGHDLGPHRELACADCHRGAGTYPHEELSRRLCLDCHQPHNEEASGDLHAGVQCTDCHLAGSGEAPHRLSRVEDQTSCRRCHHQGNKAGASAMVLPPKSVLCLACHTATLSLADWPSRIALGLLALGLLGSLGFWLSGGGQGPSPAPGHDHTWRPGAAGKALVLDGLMQRRLWRVSPGRWVTHAMIFLPFAARSAWALTALVLGRWDPAAPLTQAMLNKNHPAGALFFEITGLMILAGAALAASRRLSRGAKRLPGLPGPDWAAMGLMSLVVLSGFITEAARLAMTGAAAGASFAFAGAALSRLLPAGPGLQGVYGYLWYGHATCYAAFVAYLPFSRMRHILLAPLWFALGSGGGR